MNPVDNKTAGDPPTGHHLQVTAARKNYGSVEALAGVDFQVQPGEFLVLLGPSGSGKSTLIRSLAGVETLDSGLIALSGRTVSDGRRHVASEHRDLAMVFQDYALWPHLSVAGNVGYALRRRRYSAPERHRRVAQALERVGLAHHLHRYPHQLSGGEQQRIAIARALVHRPALLLADEPTGNLDSANGDSVLHLLRELTDESQTALILVTHSDEAAAICHRQIHLRDGRMTESQPHVT